jgi:hypothetical protein
MSHTIGITTWWSQIANDEDLSIVGHHEGIGSSAHHTTDMAIWNDARLVKVR